MTSDAHNKINNVVNQLNTVLDSVDNDTYYQLPELLQEILVGLANRTDALESALSEVTIPESNWRER